MEMEGLFLAYLFLEVISLNFRIGRTTSFHRYWNARRSQYDAVDPSPTPPQFFLAREVDMYHVP